MGRLATLRFPSSLIEPDVPISGIRFSDWFIVGHTEKKLEPRAFRYGEFFLLRPTIQLSLKGPDRICVARLIANHRHLTTFENTPEVRVLCSAGIAQLQRSYDPVRPPSGPPPVATLRSPPSPSRVSLDYPNHLSDVPCPLPQRIERVRPTIASRSRGLPQMAGGSASALSLSRPAQASLALRPAGSLSRLKRPLSRGSSPASCPAKPLVSFRINRQLSGWKSSTDNSRLRGALPIEDMTGRSSPVLRPERSCRTVSLEGRSDYGSCIVDGLGEKRPSAILRRLKLNFRVASCGGKRGDNWAVVL